MLRSRLSLTDPFPKLSNGSLLGFALSLAVKSDVSSKFLQSVCLCVV